jgi:predicted RNA-binding Zn-ribbon protein involved in translation (DUF1610 family)
MSKTNKRNWIEDSDSNDFKISKREVKKNKKTAKCPNCGKEVKSTCVDCELTIDRRGGWRQLGIYDG